MAESKENFLPEHSSFWKVTRVSRLTEMFIETGAKLFGMAAFTKSPVVTELYVLCWVLEILMVTFGAFYTKITRQELSMDDLMITILFLAVMMAHLMILLDSLIMQKKRLILQNKFATISTQLQRNLRIPLDPVQTAAHFSLVVASVTLGLVVCHLVILWTIFKPTTTGNTIFYWYMLPTVIALQFKMLQIFCSIIVINEMVVIVHRNINAIGERNLQHIFKPLSSERRTNQFILVAPMDDDDDETQLVTIMGIYSELYVLFKQVTFHYGWSLLGMTALYFVDFVCNSYWIFLAIITQGRDLNALVQNIGFISMVLLMLLVLCWNCQKTFNYSRSIGCLVFKLVKPRGNKRYNSLVSDFSLQTLHQRFVVTAKDFFAIDLNLLGNMVAAIVTYLVILIQMMYTTKNTAESLLTTKAPIRTTTLSTVVLQTSSGAPLQ